MNEYLLQLLTNALELAEMAWKINDGEDVDTLNGLAFNLIPKLMVARASAPRMALVPLADIERIANCSDREMGDGDMPREWAKALLTARQAAREATNA